MAENENNDSQTTPDETTPDETVPDETVPAEEPTPVVAQDAPTPGPVRWRDRAFSFRSMIAVGVATLLLGGAGGALLVAATDDGDHQRMSHHDGPGRGGDQGRYDRGPGGGFRGGADLSAPETTPESEPGTPT